VGRLLGVLDALGDRVELEGVAQLDDRVGQGGVLPTPADPVPNADRPDQPLLLGQGE
jgi:hypothetical protein